jgi:hypothetical protein
LPAAHFDQAAAQPRSIAEPTASRAEHKTVKRPAVHRPRHAVRRAHASFAHRWSPTFWEACRYRCGWAEPVTWHGGGY